MQYVEYLFAGAAIADWGCPGFWSFQVLVRSRSSERGWPIGCHLSGRLFHLIATNCAKSTSAFVMAEDDCSYAAKNDVIGTCVFALGSFVLCIAGARCVLTS